MTLMTITITTIHNYNGWLIYILFFLCIAFFLIEFETVHERIMAVNEETNKERLDNATEPPKDVNVKNNTNKEGRSDRQL